MQSDADAFVLDADALNLMSPATEYQWPNGVVLTPHPAEAGRLLGVTTEAVQADRAGALEALVSNTQSVVVLKGAGTLVGAPERSSIVVPGAAPALAAAGTGDVLSGVIAGLLAQGAAPYDAALCAVWLHAAAGRQLGANRGGRGVLAGEIAEAIPRQIEHLIRGWRA
jgi:ADP-dependent NAD(P)H-hydrate dehydratase